MQQAITCLFKMKIVGGGYVNRVYFGAVIEFFITKCFGNIAFCCKLFCPLRIAGCDRYSDAFCINGKSFTNECAIFPAPNIAQRTVSVGKPFAAGKLIASQQNHWSNQVYGAAIYQKPPLFFYTGRQKCLRAVFLQISCWLYLPETKMGFYNEQCLSFQPHPQCFKMMLVMPQTVRSKALFIHKIFLFFYMRDLGHPVKRDI